MKINYQIPTFLQRLYRGVLWRKDMSRPVVYLTFDDGPIPEVTPQLLDILHEKGVKATFFMVADNAVKYLDLLHRVREEGHSIGNHTYHHLRGTCYPIADYMRDVEQADAVLQTRLFRPPYGRMTCSEKRALRQAGYTIVLWDILTHDYDAAYSADRLFDIVRRNVRYGSIINFHDSLKSGSRMLAAVPRVIDYLQSQGYAFEVL